MNYSSAHQIFDGTPEPGQISSIWRLTGKRANPLVVLNKGASDPHVYCIHGVTGDVIGLQGFAEQFGDRVLHAIQVPKEQMNGSFVTSIEAIATRHVEIIQNSQPDGPIHLVGWSAGAIIALEMACQFKQRGRDVPLLAALDGAPCNTGAGLKAWDPRYLLALAINLPRWIKDDTSQDWSLSGIINRIEGKIVFRFGSGVPLRAPSMSSQDTLDGETITKLAERSGWQSDQKAFIHGIYKAMIDYVPKPYDGHVIAYETRTQPLIRLRQIGAAWKAIAPHTEVVTVEGNHSRMIEYPAIVKIAQHFVSRLT
jgi:thioesterase domain-containing protein